MNHLWWCSQVFVLLYVHALFGLSSLGQSVIAPLLLLAYLVTGRRYEVREYSHTVCGAADGEGMSGCTHDAESESGAREPFYCAAAEVQDRGGDKHVPSTTSSHSDTTACVPLTAYETRACVSAALTWPLPCSGLLWSSLVLSAAQLLCLVVLRCYYGYHHHRRYTHDDNTTRAPRAFSALCTPDASTRPPVALLSWPQAGLASIAAAPAGAMASMVLTAVLLAVVITMCGVLLWLRRGRDEGGRWGWRRSVRRCGGAALTWYEYALLAASLAVAAALLPTFDAALFLCLFFFLLIVAVRGGRLVLVAVVTTRIIGVLWLGLELGWRVPLVRRGLAAARVDVGHLPWLRHWSVAVGDVVGLEEDGLAALRSCAVWRCRCGQLLVVLYGILVAGLARQSGCIPADEAVRPMSQRSAARGKIRGCVARGVGWLRHAARRVGRLGVRLSLLRPYAVSALVLVQVVVALLVLDLFALVLLVNSLAYLLVPPLLFRQVCSPVLYAGQGVVLLAEYIALQLPALQGPLLMSYTHRTPLGSARLVALLLGELAALGLTRAALHIVTKEHTRRRGSNYAQRPLPSVSEATAVRDVLREHFVAVCDDDTGVVSRERFPLLLQRILPAAYVQRTLRGAGSLASSSSSSLHVAGDEEDETVIDELYRCVCSGGGNGRDDLRDSEDDGVAASGAHRRRGSSYAMVGNALPRRTSLPASPASRRPGVAFADFVTLVDAVQSYRAQYSASRARAGLALLRIHLSSFRHTAVLSLLFIVSVATMATTTTTPRTSNVLTVPYVPLLLLLLLPPLRKRALLWRGLMAYASVHVLLMSALTAYCRVYAPSPHAMQLLRFVGAPSEQHSLVWLGYVVVALLAHGELGALATHRTRKATCGPVSAVERVLQDCEWRACRASSAACALRHTLYLFLLLVVCLLVMLVWSSPLTALYGVLLLLYVALRAEKGRALVVAMLGMYAAAVVLWWTAVWQFPAMQRGVLRSLGHSPLCPRPPSPTPPCMEAGSAGRSDSTVMYISQARLQWCAVRLGLALPAVPYVWPWLLPWYASCALCAALCRCDTKEEKEERCGNAVPSTQYDDAGCGLYSDGGSSNVRWSALPAAVSSTTVRRNVLAELPPVLCVVDGSNGLYLLGRSAMLHMRLVCWCHRALHAFSLLYKALNDWLVFAAMLCAAFVPPSALAYVILLLHLLDVKGRPALALATLLLLLRYVFTLPPLTTYTVSSSSYVRSLLGLSTPHFLTPLLLLVIALGLSALLRASRCSRHVATKEDVAEEVQELQQQHRCVKSPPLSIGGIYAIARHNISVLLCSAACVFALTLGTSLVVRAMLLVHLVLLYVFLWLRMPRNRIVAWLLDILLALELLTIYALYLLCTAYSLPANARDECTASSVNSDAAHAATITPRVIQVLSQYMLTVPPADLMLVCIVHYFQRRLRYALSAAFQHRDNTENSEERRGQGEGAHEPDAAAATPPATPAEPDSHQGEGATQPEGHAGDDCTADLTTELASQSGILCLVQPFFVLSTILGVTVGSAVGWLLTAATLVLFTFPRWLVPHFGSVHIGLSLGLGAIALYSMLVLPSPAMQELLNDLAEHHVSTYKLLLLLGLRGYAEWIWLLWAVTCVIGTLQALVYQAPQFMSALQAAIAEAARQAPQRRARLLRWLKEKQWYHALRIKAERCALLRSLEEAYARAGLSPPASLDAEANTQGEAGVHAAAAQPRGVQPGEAGGAGGGEDVPGAAAATGLRLQSSAHAPSAPPPPAEVTVQVATPPTPPPSARVPWIGLRAMLYRLVKRITLYVHMHTNAPTVLPDKHIGTFSALVCVIARYLQYNLPYVCYAAFALRLVLGGTILDALPSLTAFLYGLRASPSPSLCYWRTALICVAALMMLKYAACLALLRFAPSGTARLVIRILLMRFSLDDGTIREGSTIRLPYFTRLSWAAWFDIMSTFAVYAVVLCQQPLCGGGDTSADASLPWDRAVATAAAGGDGGGGGAAAARAGAVTRVGRWRDGLSRPPSGTGADYYAAQFAFDAAALPLLALVYFRVTGNAGGDAAEGVRLNLLPGPLVLLMLGCTAMLVLERVAYVRRSLWLKWVLHMCTAVVCHVPLALWLWRVPDAAATTTMMTRTMAPVYLLLTLRLVGLWFSALQLRAGYAMLPRCDAFTAKTDTLHWFGYTVLRCVPFLTELRILLDWSLSRTALKVQHWFLLDGVHNALYKRYVDMHDLSRTSAHRGQAFPRFVKLYQGGLGSLGIILLLFFPLFYYSTFSPQMGHSGVASWSMELSLSSGGPIYTAMAHDATTSGNSMASGVPGILATAGGGVQERLRQSVWAQIPQARQDGYGLESTIQVLQWPRCSAQMWSIAPPAMYELLARLDAALDLASTTSPATTAAPSSSSITISTTHTITRTPRASRAGTFITDMPATVASEAKLVLKYDLPPASVRALRQELARLASCSSESCAAGSTALSEGKESESTSWIALPHFMRPYVRFLPLEVDFLAYREVDCGLQLHRVSASQQTAGNYTQPSALYWCVQCALPEADGNHNAMGRQLPASVNNTNNSSDDNKSNDGSLFAIVSTLDVLLTASGLLSLLPNLGIVALYTTFVIAIGNLVRGVVTGDVYRVPLLQLANPEPVARLLRNIYAARAFAAEGHSEDLVLEQELFLELVDLLRTTDRLVEVSGRRVNDYDASGQYRRRLRDVCEHPFSAQYYGNII